MNATRPDRRLIPLAAFFAASFLFHLLWENLQMPLYANAAPFREHFWICLKATATGDMLFMITIYGALAVVHQNAFWISHRALFAHPATWTIALLVGFLLAVGMELWAVYVDYRWAYAEAMPMVPVLGIGLTPVLQMMLIPPMTLLLSRSLTRP